MAASNRIKCYAKALMQVGTQVEVVTYLRTERKDTLTSNGVASGVYEGIPYRYIGGITSRRSNLFLRKWDDLVDFYRLIKYIYSLKEGDCVICYNDFNLNTPFIISAAHFHNIIFIAEVCELPYGVSKETHITKLKRKLTEFLQIPRYDGAIVISRALEDYVKKHTKARCILCRIPILVDFPKYSLKDLSSTQDEFYIFHAGTLFEQKDGIIGLIKACAIACKKLNYKLYFKSTGYIDKSPHAEDIKKVISEYKVEKNVAFLGYLSNDELQDYLSKASLVIINKYDNQQNRYCFSTKLAEYLAASKPLIITNVGEAPYWLNNKRDSFIVEAGDVNSIATAIIELYNNDSLRETISMGGRETCKSKFDLTNYGNTLIDFLNTCRSQILSVK